MKQGKVFFVKGVHHRTDTQATQGNKDIGGQQRDTIFQVPALLKEAGLDAAGLYPIPVRRRDKTSGSFIGTKIALIEPLPAPSYRSYHQLLGYNRAEVELEVWAVEIPLDGFSFRRGSQEKDIEVGVEDSFHYFLR
jgi:hypothetical protein